MVELVQWIDSFGLCPGWTDPDDLDRYEPLRISSVGKVLRETADFVLLAGSWGEREGAQVGGVLAIPKRSIVKRRRLR